MSEFLLNHLGFPKVYFLYVSVCDARLIEESPFGFGIELILLSYEHHQVGYARFI
jgi:hypothetical protein